MTEKQLYLRSDKFSDARKWQSGPYQDRSDYQSAGSVAPERLPDCAGDVGLDCCWFSEIGI